MTRRRAFTLAEAVMSIAILGGVLVAGLGALGTASAAQRRATNEIVGRTLAEELLGEILARDYQEGGGAVTLVLGPGLGEVSGASRAAFDDVDDYAGLTEVAAVDRAGTTLDVGTGWARTVEVVWVEPTTLDTSITETGAKRITVTALRNGTPVCSVVSIRTCSWILGSGGP